MAIRITAGDPDPERAVSRVDRPQRRTDVVVFEVGQEAIVVADDVPRPIVLNPIARQLWLSFDGATSLLDLTADLEWAIGLDPESAAIAVESMVRSLAAAGFLAEPRPSTPVLPRRVHPRVPTDSCLGRRLGLGRASTVQIETPSGAAFRVGCTDSSLLDAAVNGLPVVPLDERDLETIYLRATKSSAGRPRLQQLFDPLGDPLYVGRDCERAAESLVRSVAALHQRHTGVWLEGVTLERDGAAVAVHPAFRSLVTGPARSALGDRGIGCVPSGYVRLDDSLHVESPAAVHVGLPSERYDLVAVLAPETSSRSDRIRSLLHLARRWDGDHVRAIAALADADLLHDQLRGGTVDPNAEPEAVVAAIEALF